MTTPPLLGVRHLPGPWRQHPRTSRGATCVGKRRGRHHAPLRGGPTKKHQDPNPCTPAHQMKFFTMCMTTYPLKTTGVVIFAQYPAKAMGCSSCSGKKSTQPPDNITVFRRLPLGRSGVGTLGKQHQTVLAQKSRLPRLKHNRADSSILASMKARTGARAVGNPRLSPQEQARHACGWNLRHSDCRSMHHSRIKQKD